MNLHRLLTSLVLVASGLLVAAAPTQGIDHSRGTPGMCPGADGVTVVVDFGALGGTPIVRCFPDGTRGSGLDALKGAGFQVAGVQRWGESFICRIENRPSAAETLAIPGDDAYREACVDTPPASAYWSYWHAGNNCTWTYSQWGVKNRDFVPGSFEGWSFSLGVDRDESPAPRVKPVRPGTENTSCGASPEPTPRTDDRDERAPRTPTQNPKNDSPALGTDTDPGSSADPTSQAGPDEAGSAAAPLPRGRRTSDSRTSSVEFTGGEDAPDVADVLAEESGPTATPWVVALVLAGLGAASVLTAQARRRRSV